MTSIRSFEPMPWLGPILLLGVLGCPSDDDPMMTSAVGPDGGSLEGGSTAGDATSDTGDGTAPPTSTSDADGTDTLDDDPSSGSSGEQPEHVVVYQRLCQPCHGDAGQGVTAGVDVGPEIRHAHPDVAAYLVRNGDDNSILNAMGEGVGHPGVMPVFSTADVSDQVLGEILAWLDDFPQPSTGQELFADYCSFCHGMTGGTEVEYVSAYHNLPFLTSGASDTLPEFIAYVRAGHVLDDVGDPVPPSARREFMPPFGPEMLSDEELTLIEAWARMQ